MRRFALVPLVAFALLGACARPATLSPGTPVSATPSAFAQRAAETVATWEKAGMPKTWRLGFVPLSRERVIVTGDPGFNEQSKIAFLARYFTVHAGLPLPPPPGQVFFPDGSRLPVRLVTAEAALEDLNKPDPSQCSSPCVPLDITRIDLGVTHVLTTRGNATVPAWLFTMHGLKTPIAYMAVDDKYISDIPAPPAADYPAIDGLVAAQNVISVDGATIKYTLGVGSCDTDITPLVYETADTIALGGSVTRTDGACDAMLKLQPVTVTLTKPVGDRALIDGLDGRPLTAGPVS